MDKTEALAQAKEARELGMTNCAVILENYANGVITFDELKCLLIMEYVMERSAYESICSRGKL